MAVTDAAAQEAIPPELARPRRFRGRLSLRQFLLTIQKNSIATWPEEAFEQEFWSRRMLWRHTFVANSPDAVRHVLLDNADNYVKTDLARRLLEPGLGRGLLTAEGEVWRRQRRLMAPAFQHRRVVDFAGPIAAAAARLSKHWTSVAKPVDIAHAMSGLTLAVISEIMFSTAVDPRIALIGAGVDRYQTSIRPTLVDLLGLPGWLSRAGAQRAAAAFAQADEVIAELIARRQAAADPGSDLLGLLIAKPETGEPPLSPREIRDQVATIFTAGHETTANALAWTWYLLALHPAVERRLHDELDQVLGDRLPGFEDVARLRYTRMVIDEAMRLYPPAHTMSRRALAEDRILGRRIPRGSTLFIVPWLLHRHRLLWERPETFDPERMAPERAAKRPRFAYIPFGAGPRICIGASLAITEAVLILATLARRWRLRLVEGTHVEPIGLITLRPRGGLAMRLERR
ncbi:MAG TPA: cytochrome P450 [Stellaceae bacterium]|nr:cytochrome P450 [Stellaceae bacterium]